MSHYKTEKLYDIGDLYDWEREKLTKAFAEAQYAVFHESNDIMNLPKLGKVISDIFYKYGFLVNVDMSPCVITNPQTGLAASPPLIDLIARIDDPQNKREFDHEEKRYEVLDSKAKGEKFRGQKERVNKKPKK